MYIHKCELLYRPREDKGLSRNGWVYHIFFTSIENMREKYGDLEPPVLPNMATYCIVAVCAGAEPNNLQPGSRRCKRCHMMCLVVPLSKTWWGRL